ARLHRRRNQLQRGIGPDRAEEDEAQQREGRSTGHRSLDIAFPGRSGPLRRSPRTPPAFQGSGGGFPPPPWSTACVAEAPSSPSSPSPPSPLPNAAVPPLSRSSGRTPIAPSPTPPVPWPGSSPPRTPRAGGAPRQAHRPTSPPPASPDWLSSGSATLRQRGS